MVPFVFVFVFVSRERLEGRNAAGRDEINN
jgi:hypothetical protein